ncbi:MAG: hypothetical protein KGI59_00455 [Patescibacteria group bacterium]|nr:hypothetical protein [Patescibacteria group bacterium]MDE2172341.1 hypothetical protein [Patescibacteria group bacterium]
MKKTIIAAVVVVLVLAGIYLIGRSPGPSVPSMSDSGLPTPSVVPVVETNTSGKTTQYQNAELGFSVNYPSAWEADNQNTGVTFVMPIDQSQVSTVATLQAAVDVAYGKCAFPPVTTVNDRQTVTAGGNTFNMISMSNNVQGRSYFNRMYSLQHGSICYLFTFTSVALAPESKNLTGSNLTQAQNNNKAIVSTADSDFTNMVKSFTFVQGPAGEDETQAAPAHSPQH